MKRLRVIVAALMGVAGAGAAWGVSIDVGSATGTPGEMVSFNVTINTMGQSVAAFANNINFEAQTPILACRLGPTLVGLGGGTLLPSECEPGVNCSAVRVVFLSVPPRAIRNNVTLYTCQAQISEAAAAGTYGLVVSNQEASNPNATPIPTVLATDGFIEVVLPTPTPRPPRRSPTPTNTGLPGPPEDDDACQVVAPARSRPAWLLLFAAVVLWAARRRRALHTSAPAR